jgi:hypothetical protein
MSGWEPGIRILDRDETSIRFVVQTGRQTNCGGIARMTVRGERVEASLSIVDVCQRETTTLYRAAAMRSLGERLEREHGLKVTIEDDYEHPVDLNASKFADAGSVAGAFLAAWLHRPRATNQELIAAAAPRPQKI